MTILQATGSRALLAYIEETTWGTTPASSANWTGFRFNREGLGRDINSFESEEIRSDRMITSVLQGNQRVEGDVSFELGPDSHNLLLRHLIGGDWQTTGSAAPYTHTLEPATYLPPGLSIVKAFTDIPLYLTYSGCRVDSMTFDFPQEGIVNCTVRIMGKAEAAPSGTQPYETPLSYPSGDPYESNDTELYEEAYDPSGVPTYTTALAVVTGGRFGITNGLDGNSFVIGSTNRYSIPEGRRRIEGTFNVLFKDETLYTTFINGTAMALRIKFKDATGTYYHQFDFPRVVYRGARGTPSIDGEGGIRHDVPFRAVRHPTLGYDVALTVSSAETITLYS